MPSAETLLVFAVLSLGLAATPVVAGLTTPRELI